MEPPPDFYGNPPHHRHPQQSTPNSGTFGNSPGPSFSSEWSTTNPTPVNSPYSSDFFAQQQSDNTTIWY